MRVEVGEARLVAAGLIAPPAQPGVYAFRDGGDRLLYVGSSRDLGRRVRSYFAPGWPPASKEGRIARLAARVVWQPCGSHLEALVLEARTIQRERPHFNRRLKQCGAYAYVRFDPRDRFPRLELSRELVPGPWRYLGPFPGGRHLGAALERLADALGLRTCAGELRPDPAARACLRRDLGQCTAPCVGATAPGAYGRALARALGALGESDGRLGAARPANQVRLSGPAGGALAALRAARRAVQVLVVVAASGTRGHRLLAVSGGRLRAAVSVPDRRDRAAGFARACAALEPPPAALLEREELDEVRLVTAWLAGAEGRAATIDVARLGRAAAWAALAARVTPGPLFASCSAAQADRSPRLCVRVSRARR